MEIVTEIPHTNCTSCKKLINIYYYENYKDRICVNCLIKVNKNRYPTGICCYKPCNLCQSPHINWFCEETYGDIKSDCGKHGPHFGSSDDEICGGLNWDIFSS